MSDAPVMIMAGGTGGHVFPALAVADQLRARHVPVVWLGTERGLEARLVPRAGIPIDWITVSGLRGVGWRRLSRLLSAPAMLGQAFGQAWAVLRRRQPRLVLGMGGFVSGPGGIAACSLRIPLVIHEQNAIAGTTNRYLARLADQALAAFPDTFAPSRRALTVGNPVRAEIAALAPPAQRFAEHSHERTRLLVLGGSQGAQSLNQLTPAALAELAAAHRPDVWHQTGERLYASARAGYDQAGVTARLTPFIEDMANAYGWADLVLCRAGALTIAELCAAGVGALLVPFPHAVDDHQTANARYLQRHGAALSLAQSSLTPASLAQHLQGLLTARAQLLAMAVASRQLARADAAERVAALCLHYARPGTRS